MPLGGLVPAGLLALRTLALVGRVPSRVAESRRRSVSKEGLHGPRGSSPPRQWLRQPSWARQRVAREPQSWLQAAPTAPRTPKGALRWAQALLAVCSARVRAVGSQKVTLSVRSCAIVLLVIGSIEAAVLWSRAYAWSICCAVWRFIVTELGHLDHLLYPGTPRDIMGLLTATALLVPIIKKLGTSPIIAFLIMGVLLGPSGFDLIHNEHQAHMLAEFGIVFFLFEMGLELSIEKVLSMKYDVFGLGFAQYVVTGILIAGLAHLAAPSLPAGALVVLGGALALSTSAFVLQLIKDKGELGTRYGRASLGVLLFQDMAVVPLLVVVPLLAGAGGGGSLGTALMYAAGRSILALGIIVVVGKVVINRVFNLVTSVNSNEAFLSAAFLTVLLCSSITENLGLSNTLGAFFGGVLLAETNFRHQIEADIAPFRGMLLGLFFVTVGFSIDLGILVSEWYTILPLIAALLVVKTSVVAAACWKAGMGGSSTARTALLLAPGGEFAFVAFGLAERLGLISLHLDHLLVTATALSMSLTPVMAKLGDWLADQIRAISIQQGEDIDSKQMLSRAKSADSFVIVCGYGRIGEVVCRLLDAEETVSYIALEFNPQKTEKARKAGRPVFLADCTRREVLEKFKVSEARLVVIAVADKSAANQTAIAIRSRYPELPILVRALDSEHQDYLVHNVGVTAVVPTLPADSVLLSLPFGGAVLRRLGFAESEIDGLVEEERRKLYDKVTGPKGLLEAFRLLDEKGTGKLAPEDLRRGLLNAGKSISEEDFQELVKIPLEEDGLIDYEDYARREQRGDSRVVSLLPQWGKDSAARRAHKEWREVKNFLLRDACKKGQVQKRRRR